MSDGENTSTFGQALRHTNAAAIDVCSDVADGGWSLAASINHRVSVLGATTRWQGGGLKYTLVDAIAACPEVLASAQNQEVREILLEGLMAADVVVWKAVTQCGNDFVRHLRNEGLAVRDLDPPDRRNVLRLLGAYSILRKEA
jgi:hypothetical protein